MLTSIFIDKCKVSIVYKINIFVALLKINKTTHISNNHIHVIKKLGNYLQNLKTVGKPCDNKNSETIIYIP